MGRSNAGGVGHRYGLLVLHVRLRQFFRDFCLHCQFFYRLLYSKTSNAFFSIIDFLAKSHVSVPFSRPIFSRMNHY